MKEADKIILINAIDNIENAMLSELEKQKDLCQDKKDVVNHLKVLQEMFIEGIDNYIFNNDLDINDNE